MPRRASEPVSNAFRYALPKLGDRVDAGRPSTPRSKRSNQHHRPSVKGRCHWERARRTSIAYHGSSPHLLAGDGRYRRWPNFPRIASRVAFWNAVERVFDPAHRETGCSESRISQLHRRAVFGALDADRRSAG